MRRGDIEEKGDEVTQIRRCDVCGVAESDLLAVLVVDSGGDVVHLQDGMFRCGRMVAVDEAVTK